MIYFESLEPAAGLAPHCSSVCPQAVSLHPPKRSVGMTKPFLSRSSGDRMPRQIDYYFSLSSPWAYIGHKAFRDVVSTYGLKVNHKPVVLVELFSETGGLPPLQRHPVRQA